MILIVTMYVHAILHAVLSLVGIVKTLLEDPGLKDCYILSAKFNQDPLETFWQSQAERWMEQ